LVLTNSSITLRAVFTAMVPSSGLSMILCKCYGVKNVVITSTVGNYHP
jgi:hypothetical protein